MGAIDAWMMLTVDGCLGMRTGNIQCFIRTDGGVECDVGHDTDETQVLDRAEFMARFSHSRFVEINTGNV